MPPSCCLPPTEIPGQTPSLMQPFQMALPSWCSSSLCTLNLPRELLCESSSLHYNYCGHAISPVESTHSFSWGQSSFIFSFIQQVFMGRLPFITRPGLPPEVSHSPGDPDLRRGRCQRAEDVPRRGGARAVEAQGQSLYSASQGGRTSGNASGRTSEWRSAGRWLHPGTRQGG